MARTPQHIVFEKTREVYNFMLSGSRQTKDIVHFFSKKWTNEGFFKEDISDLSKQRTIFNYVKKVKNTFMNFEKEIESEKGRQLARLDDLYSKNMKIQDYKAAKDIIKEINSMLGLNAPSKIDNTNLNYNTDVSKDEAKQINEALENDY